MSDKKYYWLKLKKDFFKRHDIQIIESMPNGKDYILFYLKLLVESVDHDGELRFNDTVPYNEDMLSTITNTNIDVVRSAMKVFTQLKMIDLMEDKTYRMNEITKKNIIVSQEESGRDRNTPEYKLWRKSVFEKDNYTCQKCNSRGIKLNAHHIKLWSRYTDLRFDINNGTTLCEKCHKLIHGKGVVRSGRKKNVCKNNNR